jgi:hypothetical protein|tara:strand:- start:940 stop:1062 length:123 start_codon:yes stop_codon:yes gene_type:complete
MVKTGVVESQGLVVWLYPKMSANKKKHIKKATKIEDERLK